MSVFVTGATGFIGRRLVERVLERDGRIYVLVREGSQARMDELIEQWGAADRITKVVGREGRVGQRASIGEVSGAWAREIEAINELIADLTESTAEVGRVLEAVARGDLSQRMVTEIDGRPMRGAFLRTGRNVNAMVDQLNAFASEVTRVAREVGTEGASAARRSSPGWRARGRT